MEKNIILSVRPGLGAEEIEIVPESVDRLLISGGSSAGVLYGVYAFLEHLGVRFAPPGLNDIRDVVPRLSEITVESVLRDKPVFHQRGLQFVGVSQKAGEFKYYRDTILDNLPLVYSLLEWMAKKRLNNLEVSLGTRGDHGAWDPKGNILVKDPVSGLIRYRDYPALKWDERYGAQIQRNRDYLREVINYAAARGIRITLFAPEPVFIQPALDAYPELVENNGHILCPAAAASWKFIESRYKELYELFPDLQVRLFPSYDSHGSGAAWARLNHCCAACKDIPGALRIGRLVEAIVRARDSAGSCAEVSIWPWPLQKAISTIEANVCNYQRNELHKEPIPAFKNIELLAQLNYTIPQQVPINYRACFGEPIESPPYLLTPFAGCYTRHKEYASLHQIGEHIGVNSFPCVYIEGHWQAIARYLAGMQVAGLFCETGYAPTQSDPSGLYLGNVDFYAFAAWAWNPEIERAAIWREWSQLFFAEAPAAAVSILKSGYQVIKYMYNSTVTDWQSIPKRCSFREQGVEKLLHWNIPLNRDHGLAMIAEKQHALDLIDDAINKLEKAGRQLGQHKYILWREALHGQRVRAELFREFLQMTVVSALHERDMHFPEDVEALRASCANVRKLLNEKFPPLTSKAAAMQKKYAMEEVNPWGNSREDYVNIFTELAEECERRVL